MMKSEEIILKADFSEILEELRTLNQNITKLLEDTNLASNILVLPKQEIL